MQPFSKSLRGGDRRSIGKANEAARLVAARPERFPELWQCLRDPEPVVRMRAADALEKLSRRHIALFRVHEGKLLSRELDDGTAEVRWHLIAIASRLRLTRDESETFAVYLSDRVIHDPSRIVKVRRFAGHGRSRGRASRARPRRSGGW